MAEGYKSPKWIRGWCKDTKPQRVSLQKSATGSVRAGSVKEEGTTRLPADHSTEAILIEFPPWLGMDPLLSFHPARPVVSPLVLFEANRNINVTV